MNKKLKLKNIRKDKGITLIALVLTIIILIILAGVTLRIVLNQDGIIDKSKNAAEEYNKQAVKEKLELKLLNLRMNNTKSENLIMDLKQMNNDSDGTEVLLDENGEVLLEPYQDDENLYATVTLNGYEFKINKTLQIVYIDGSYQVPENKDPEEPEEIEPTEYVQDGLIVWYDGENNTGNGHSDTATKWVNLANVENKENYDGTLVNIDFNEISGWKDNALVIDGINDCVKMSYIYYENMTIEIVAKPLDINTTKNQNYICNFEGGGMGIIKNTRNQNSPLAYISGSYQKILPDKTQKIGQIYSMSAGYDGSKLYFRENNDNYTSNVTGKLGKPTDNTIYAIGINPNGTEDKTTDSIVDEARLNAEIYSVRIYNRCLTDEEIENNYKLDKKRFNIEKLPDEEDLGYVTDGLICLYDGERNTPYGHSKTNPTWIDLSGNGNDGTLKEFNYNTASGWKDKSLLLDGSNDWVQMKKLNAANNQITVEIVMKPISIASGKAQYYIANIESGGTEIFKIQDSTLYSSAMHIGGSYRQVNSNDSIDTTKITSLSTRYGNSKQYFRVNGNIYEQDMTGTYKEPSSNTVFALGTNPSGTDSSIGTGALANMEVYSVRIYNRCLTAEEVQQNYNIDKARFGIN